MNSSQIFSKVFHFHFSKSWLIPVIFFEKFPAMNAGIHFHKLMGKAVIHTVYFISLQLLLITDGYPFQIRLPDFSA